MKKLFTDHIVLITGASAGFGAAMARAFAKEGAHLILLARRQDRLSELATQLSQEFGTLSHLIEADVSCEKTVEEQLKQLPAPFETPDILINNAGLVFGLNKVWETPSEDWNKMIDINVKGILNVSKQIIPKMLAKNRGHIINVGSISSHEVYPGGSIYCATKHAVKAITDALRMELVATPLKVSMISPGLAETEFSVVRFKGDKQKAKDVYQGMTPLSAEDIAETVIFMASRPSHVNIADLIILPNNQASAAIVHRN